MTKLLPITIFSIFLPLAAHAESITIASWGGSFQQAQVDGHYHSWMESTGHQAIPDAHNGGLAEIKSQVETGVIKWDVADVGTDTAVVGCEEGFFHQIDRSKLPNGGVDDFMPGSLEASGDCGIPTVSAASVMAYNVEAFLNGAPQSWYDFWDLEQFPGKRALINSPNPSLIFALIADGVPGDQAYTVLATPEGVDRAFAKLDEIKDSVVWWESGAQSPQLLADGEVTMAHAYNGRIFSAVVSDDQPFAISWNGAHVDFDVYVILKGTEHLDLALDFVYHATSTDSQINTAKYIAYGPTRLSAQSVEVTYADDSSVNMSDHLPSNAFNYATQDPTFWADHGAELEDRWQNWLIK